MYLIIEVSDRYLLNTFSFKKSDFLQKLSGIDSKIVSYSNEKSLPIPSQITSTICLISFNSDDSIIEIEISFSFI